MWNEMSQCPPLGRIVVFDSRINDIRMVSVLPDGHGSYYYSEEDGHRYNPGYTYYLGWYAVPVMRPTYDGRVTLINEHSVWIDLAGYGSAVRIDRRVFEANRLPVITGSCYRVTMFRDRPTKLNEEFLL